jgi:primosomal protein N' (replication factor Y)
MKIETVVPLKKGAWKEDLTYFTMQDVSNGSIVTIPLRSKKVFGLVVDVEDASKAKSDIKDMSFNLKKIIEVKEHSVFLKEYLESAILVSKYFVSNKNNGITSLLPAVFRENYDKLNSKDGLWGNSLKDRPYLKSEKLLFQAPKEDRFSVYKTLIRGSFAQKKSVFVVLPTERDIKIFTEALSRGIEQFTFCIHSGIAPKKTLAIYEKIMTSNHPILIIGTAPFLSIPRTDIETIILEHESSTSYKMVGKPHFDLKVFTEIYASKINAKFIMADQMLRFETIGRKDTDNLNPLHPLSFRTNFNGEIKIQNPNPKDGLLGDSQRPSLGFKVLNDKSVEEIQNAINKKQNMFIFALRKGLATMTVCRDCGDMLSCDKCSAPLVLYTSHQGKKRMFVCNRCMEDKDGDISCPSCGSWNLMPLGIGVDTVYEEIEKLFPKTKIFKLDKENAKTAKGAEKIIKEFEENEGSILIGTEMALFYIKEKVSLSIIASFDSLWSIPNFKMSEKIIQIILSIINNTDKKVIIQTKNENDPALLSIQSENLLSFVREELEDRKKLEYPPFKRFIKITHLGDKEQTVRARKILEEIFAEYHPEIFSGFVARLKGKYMTNALIKMEPKKWSLPEISTNSHIDENLLTKLLSLPSQFEIFVDPEDLL